MHLKNSIKHVLSYLRHGGPRVSTGLGQNPFQDMRRLAVPSFRPVIFDVGANVGQSINLFRRNFEHSIIHSFEPSPCTFKKLQHRTTNMPDLHLNNFALGAQSELRVFIENTNSCMNSLLEPGTDCWGEVKERYQVEISTLDNYCAKQGVTHIDILKSDTQGFDLEVIRGGQELIKLRRIHLIYMEIIFSDQYKGIPRLDEIYGFLVNNGFSLVTFYTFHYQHDRAGWTDALFINPEYRQSRVI